MWTVTSPAMPASWVRVAQRRSIGPRGWAEWDFHDDGDAAEIDLAYSTDLLNYGRRQPSETAARNLDRVHNSGITGLGADERILTVWRQWFLWSFPRLTATLPPEFLASPRLFYASCPINGTSLSVPLRLRSGPNTYSLLSSVNTYVVTSCHRVPCGTHIV
jgi:hypothetical protein